MPPVQQSAPKWELLLALDLEHTNPAHKNLYALMKSEAVNVYDERLKGCRSALKPQFANAPEPWSSNQFLDSALRQAIELIVTRASHKTRPLYARAPMNGDNWVAKWMLYHVCRYRDSRNTRCRSTNYHDDDVLFRANSSGRSSNASSSSSVTGSGSRSGFYDAARNSYRPS